MARILHYGYSQSKPETQHACPDFSSSMKKRDLPTVKKLHNVLPATLTFASAISLVCAEMAIADEASNADDDLFIIEEVIVTAQRRSQSIQEVANSVEAITGDVLDQLGKVGLADYINSIGGAGYTRTGSGAVKLGMRGISPIGQTDQFAFAQTVSTVGLYLDDVAVQGAGSLPDLNLYDMQRVEVLKGPQGTLYGDGAMGGAIKMILNKPDLQTFAAKAEITAIDTQGADLGHRIRGAVNIPVIEDKLAVRLVGSSSEKKGWIDNIATGEDGVNDSDSWSLRATALAQISEKFSAELMLMHDQQELDDYAQEVIGLGDYKTDLLEDEFNDVEVDLYALTLKYDLGFAELTSITSLFEKERTLSSRTDFSLATLLTDPAYSDNTFLAAYDEEETFSQELRLVSSGDNTLDWTLGLFYRDRDRDVCSAYDSPATQGTNDALPDFLGLDYPATTFDCEVTPDSGLDSVNIDANETFEQKAAYGELNYEITETVELTAGLRYFKEDVSFEEERLAYGVIAFLGAPPSTNSSTDEDVLFKLGISWAATDDQLYYFNIAEGFRSGGSNLQASTTLEPERFRSYESDSLINYELGAKTSWHDGKLILNGALYFSDWTDIQTQITVPTIAATTTVLTPGGDAEVTGIELSTMYLASENLSMGLSLNLQEAEFTDTIADANIVDGSDLPNAPELTGSLFIQYSQDVKLGEVFARVGYRYIDEQRSVVEPIVSAAPPYDDDTTILDSYELTNLTLGLRTENWYVTGYINNLFDERHVVAYGYGQDFIAEGANPTLTSVGTPRTVGLTVGISF